MGIIPNEIILPCIVVNSRKWLCIVVQLGIFPVDKIDKWRIVNYIDAEHLW